MGLRKAINEFCRMCIYDPGQGGTWRQQVDACAAVTCPLYEVRPKVTKGRDEQDELVGGADSP
jgi:hypothetical protein